MMNEELYFDSLSYLCQKEGKNKIEGHVVYDIFEALKGTVGINQIHVRLRESSFTELKNMNKQVHQHSSLSKDEQEAVTSLVLSKLEADVDLKTLYEKVLSCAEKLENASLKAFFKPKPY